VTQHNTPLSVLRAIARACGCAYIDIESRLEKLNDDAGIMPRPMERKVIAEERLYVIRRWLNTPEAASVIDVAHDYVRRMSQR
jgi:hypothetical protein